MHPKKQWNCNQLKSCHNSKNIEQFSLQLHLVLETLVQFICNLMMIMYPLGIVENFIQSVNLLLIQRGEFIELDLVQFAGKAGDIREITRCQVVLFENCHSFTNVTRAVFRNNVYSALGNGFPFVERLAAWASWSTETALPDPLLYKSNVYYTV